MLAWRRGGRAQQKDGRCLDYAELAFDLRLVCLLENEMMKEMVASIIMSYSWSLSKSKILEGKPDTFSSGGDSWSEKERESKEREREGGGIRERERAMGEQVVREDAAAWRLCDGGRGPEADGGFSLHCNMIAKIK